MGAGVGFAALLDRVRRRRTAARSAPTHLTTSARDGADQEVAPGLGAAADQRLRELADLHAPGLIDREQYAASRAEILGTL